MSADQAMDVAVEQPAEQPTERMDTSGAPKKQAARGLPKSGPVVEESAGRSSAIVKVKPLHTKWQTKMKKKADDQQVKARQTEIREALAAERQEKKNIEKNEIVQVIKNTEKLKRLNKKQMRSIKKMDTTELLKKLA
ncbi:Coiled-coil domain-containing protein 86 [Aphelenchoides fujianensis]|nr:Coiled-coil domain-containing protein 86 [Aphelenchoides fujianensis]